MQFSLHGVLCWPGFRGSNAAKPPRREKRPRQRRPKMREREWGNRKKAPAQASLVLHQIVASSLAFSLLFPVLGFRSPHAYETRSMGRRWYFRAFGTFCNPPRFPGPGCSISPSLSHTQAQNMLLLFPSTVNPFGDFETLQESSPLKVTTVAQRPFLSPRILTLGVL